MIANATAQTRRQSVDLLVLGGTVVTMDQTRRVIDDGGIAVSQGRVVAQGEPPAICRQTQSATLEEAFLKATGHLEGVA